MNVRHRGPGRYPMAQCTGDMLACCLGNHHVPRVSSRRETSADAARHSNKCFRCIRSIVAIGARRLIRHADRMTRNSNFTGGSASISPEHGRRARSRHSEGQTQDRRSFSVCSSCSAQPPGSCSCPRLRCRQKPNHAARSLRRVELSVAHRGSSAPCYAPKTTTRRTHLSLGEQPCSDAMRINSVLTAIHLRARGISRTGPGRRLHKACPAEIRRCRGRKTRPVSRSPLPN